MAVIKAIFFYPPNPRLSVMHPYLLILTGIPASGKSTLAGIIAEILIEKDIPVVIVSSDKIREMVLNDHFDPDYESFVMDSMRSCIFNALKHGFFVICDDLNYYESMRRKLKDIASETGNEYGIVFVSTPPEIAKEWNRKRGGKIPEELIDEVYYKLDIPGKKYRWDRPIYTVDLSEESPEKAVEEILRKIERSFRKKVKGKIKKIPAKTPYPARDIERETRRAMGAIMREYRPAEVAGEISRIRKEVVRYSLENNIPPEKSVEIFLQRVKPLLANVEFTSGRKISLNIGLFGHIDHGKTSIARCLTQTPSTASLDKHPDAQKRGMTIDMGFSAFKTEKYHVTLVDLPGHHSLMNHVTGGASIIDGAILVIDAVDGINVQTVEHFALIRGLGLRLIIALNKCDLVSKDRLKEVTEKTGKMLSGYPAEIVRCSAKDCSGIDEIIKLIDRYIPPPARNVTGGVKIPVDHSFHIPGAGTVVTGTILRGKIEKGDTLYLFPGGVEVRIRGIQIFKRDVENAMAGQRVALSLSGVKPDEIERGFVLSSGNLPAVRYIRIKFRKEPFYQHRISVGEVMHIGSGLFTSTCKIYPVDLTEGIPVLTPAGDEFEAVIKLSRPLIIEEGDMVMLYRADLSPKSVRVAGVGEVTEVFLRTPEIFRKKIRRVVFRKERNGYLCPIPLDKSRHLDHVLVDGGRLKIIEFRKDGILLDGPGEGEHAVEFFRRVSL